MLQLLYTYLPALKAVFGSQLIGAGVATIVAVGLAILCVAEAETAVVRRWGLGGAATPRSPVSPSEPVTASAAS